MKNINIIAPLSIKIPITNSIYFQVNDCYRLKDIDMEMRGIIYIPIYRNINSSLWGKIDKKKLKKSFFKDIFAIIATIKSMMKS